jgi:hypothetical protein
MVDDDFSPSWFKYRRIKRKSKYGENNTDPTYTCRTRVISCLVFGRPDYFNLSSQQLNITGIITVLLGFAGASIFYPTIHK